MTRDEVWLAAVWPFVRDWLPAAPARVVEVGCGPLGGFVPRLAQAGFEATGVDPQAPDGQSYRQARFEDVSFPGQAEAIVACLALHHVGDLGRILGLVHGSLVPGGRVIVVEPARERFDEATARWCFDRLPQVGDSSGSLHQRRAEWRASGLPWEEFMRSWIKAKGLYTERAILRELDARFTRGTVSFAPYFFPDLDGTSEADEQAAIDAGLIRANRLQYVGSLD